MTRLVVLAEFCVEPEAYDGFRCLIMDNAAASLKWEPGCHHFDQAVAAMVVVRKVERLCFAFSAPAPA